MTDHLALAEFAENPERRCPVVLVLDTSASMNGKPIEEVNDGLGRLEGDLKRDPVAALRVELAVVTFGGRVETLDVRRGEREGPLDAATAFVTADGFSAPKLTAHGETPMGLAVRRGLQLLRERKDLYRQVGISYYRPWLLLISDGQPTDEEWELAAADAVWEEGRGGVMVFPIGVEKADLAKLGRFSAERAPLKLRSIAQFGDLFAWLSSSLGAVANSRPGDQVELPAPAGWAVIRP